MHCGSVRQVGSVVCVKSWTSRAARDLSANHIAVMQIQYWDVFIKLCVKPCLKNGVRPNLRICVRRTHKNIQIYTVLTVRSAHLYTLFSLWIPTCFEVCARAQAPCSSKDRPIIVLKRSMLIKQWIFLVHNEPLLTYHYTGKLAYVQKRRARVSYPSPNPPAM